MNPVLLSKENNIARFSFETSPEVLEEGLQYAYEKNKANISIPGFRKGKVPRKLIESQYGPNFFYEDAINHIFPDAYEEAARELGLDVVSRPTLDVEDISKETGVKFVVDVTVKPPVTLGQYKELSVERVPVEVTEEEIIAELEKAQQKNARTVAVTDRPAQKDDMAIISYAGTVDGVPFEGGQSDSHALTLGSGAFIPGFEEQIMGKNVGDTFDVNVTFPTEYHAAELAGKDAVFTVVLKELNIREMPELNDEFAEDVSDFSTLEEYKASLAEKLRQSKEEAAKQVQGEKLLDLAVQGCTMDVPQVMYDNKLDQLMQEFSQNLGQTGLSLDLYCQYMNTTAEELRENFKDTAVKSVKARLMLEQIAKEEGITIPKEKLDEEIGRFGESYGLPPEQMLEMFRPEDRANMELDMLVHDALAIIEDTAILTDPVTEEA